MSRLKKHERGRDGKRKRNDKGKLSKRNLMEARMNLISGLYLYEKTLSIYEYSVN